MTSSYIIQFYLLGCIHMYHYYRLNIAGLTVNMRNKRYQRLDRLQEDLFSICENARELSRTDSQVNKTVKKTVSQEFNFDIFKD